MRTCPKCLSIHRDPSEHCLIDGTALTDRRTDPLIGRDIAGYRVLRCLGSGASSAVYAVRSRFTGADYAMKILFAEKADDPRTVDRFWGTAKSLQAIDNPRILKVFDYGSGDTGLKYAVMELVQGEPLSHHLARAGGVAGLEALMLVQAIAEILHEVHDQGIVHRDIKPSNILMVTEPPYEDRSLHLLDFGSAIHFRDPQPWQRSATGQFVGTPLYMAPEQYLTPNNVSPAADLYALGIMMYEMLTGHPPFNSSNITDLLVQHAQASVPKIEDGHPLEAFVGWLLEKDPKDRPQSAQHLVDVIEGETPAPPGFLTVDRNAAKLLEMPDRTEVRALSLLAETLE